MSDDATKRVPSPEKVSKAYSSPPWWYDIRGFFILKLTYRSSLFAQIAFFEKNMRDKHLEVAIGTGTLFGMILKRRRKKGGPMPHVVGVDYAERMLDGARHRFRDDPNIELQQADVTKMGYSDNSFDSVNIANAIHCFSDVDTALREIYRVLKPGGTLAVNALLYPRGLAPFRWIANRINRWGIRKGILVSPFHYEEIRNKFLAQGFRILEDTISGNCCDILAQKPEAAPATS